MKNSFLISFAVALILLILGLTINIELFRNISLGIAVVFILISALTGGVFTSSEQQRANYHTETKEDRSTRTKMMAITGIISLPHFATTALLFYL